MRERFYVDRSESPSVLRYRGTYGHVVPNWIVNSRALHGIFDKIKRVALFAGYLAVALSFVTLIVTGGIPAYAFFILGFFLLGSIVMTALSVYFDIIADNYEIRLNETPERAREKKLVYDSEIVQFGYISDEFELGLVSMPRKVYNVANSWISRQNRMDVADVHALLTKDESRALRKSLVTGLSLLRDYNTLPHSEMSLGSKATQDVLSAFDKLNELLSYYEEKEKDSRQGNLDTSLSSVDDLVGSVVGRVAKEESINPDLD